MYFIELTISDMVIAENLESRKYLLSKIMKREVNTMKQNLKHSKHLMVIYFLIAVMTLLTVTHLVNTYRMETKSANGLSENHVKFSMMEYSDAFSIYQNLEKEENWIIEMELADGIMGVCYKGFPFHPQILSGRSFSKEDFSKQRNVVLIATSMKRYCEKEGDTLYYYLDNMKFEVIGIYEKENNFVNEDANVYINFTASQMVNFSASGYVYVDSEKRNPISFVSAFEKDAISIQEERGKITNKDFFVKNIKDQELTVQAYAVVLLVMVCNLVSIINQWIYRRKKEIYVLRLVGANNRNIRKKIDGDMLMVILISFVTAIPVWMVLTRFPMHYYCCEISFVSIGLSIAVFMGSILYGILIEKICFVCLKWNRRAA